MSIRVDWYVPRTDHSSGFDPLGLVDPDLGVVLVWAFVDISQASVDEIKDVFIVHPGHPASTLYLRPQVGVGRSR